MLLIAAGLAVVYLEDRFGSTDEIGRSWRMPRARKGLTLGRVRLSSGNFHGDERKQRGMETMDQKTYYLLYRNFTKRFDTRGKTLVVQFTVRMHSKMECGGHYIKLFDGSTDIGQFNNRTAFSLMFGPDTCGADYRRTHFIIGHNGSEYSTHKLLTCPKNHLTHSYQLVLYPNKTYRIKIDGDVVDEATLAARFDIPNVTEIPASAEVKPVDWDDEEWVEDKDDVKPAGWVDDRWVPDTSAAGSWSSGEWVAPMKRNPAYRGEWRPRLVPNPAYKGPWVPSRVSAVAGPDPTFGEFPQLAFLALDVYQGHANSIFNNFLVTDDEAYANEVLEDRFFSLRRAEAEHFDVVAGTKRKERQLTEQHHDIEREHRHRDHGEFSTGSDTDVDYFDQRRRAIRQRKQPLQLEVDPFEL